MKVRLQKVLADAGIASRRASEELITSGRVRVNGELVRELGVRVDPESDSVSCDGRPVKPRRKLYVALHKPRGVLCTRERSEERRTVLDLIPAEWSNVYPVGRLDYESEGLLFLTNDGEFCLRLTHPRYGIRKKYQVTLDGPASPAILKELLKGVWHDGQLLRAASARLLETESTHSLVELELTEGRYREIRRMFEVVGGRVVRLRRIQIGPIALGQLKPGRWRILQPAEIRSLTAAPDPGPAKGQRARHQARHPRASRASGPPAYAAGPARRFPRPAKH